MQMPVSAVTNNIPVMEHRLATLLAIYPWVQMVVFSELAAHGPLLSKAEAVGGPSEQAFRDMARKHKVWLIPGSIYQQRDGKIYNMAHVMDPDGNIVSRYDKIFPFRPYEVGVEAGTDFCVFDVPDVGRFGVSICYDMWFPETTRTLALMGAEVILHPSLTPSIDRDVELAIARASAVQNQCYIFDINGVGAGGNGRSIVCGPEGNILYQAGNNEEMIPLEIDLDRVKRSRERGILNLGQVLKSFRDRSVEFDIYKPGQENQHLQSLGPLKKPERVTLPQIDSQEKQISGLLESN
jgi:predicted amidohydrolase